MLKSLRPTWPRTFEISNPRSSDEWTEARIQIMLRLDAEDNLSRSGIANELARLTGSKFSRNAIIGKLARLGVPKKGLKTSIPKMEQYRRVRIRSDRPQKPIPEPVILQESLRLSLMDLTETTCRFPTNGEDEPFHFCGHPISRQSYCAAHVQISYYAPRNERPDAAHRMRIMNASKYRESLLKPRCEASCG